MVWAPEGAWPIVYWMHGLNEQAAPHVRLVFLYNKRVCNRQRWHASSRNSNRDNIPVKRRDLFPASICQSWSRKRGRSDDHFSENACVQAQMLLSWETKPCKGTEAKHSAALPPSLPPALPADHCCLSAVYSECGSDLRNRWNWKGLNH